MTDDPTDWRRQPPLDRGCYDRLNHDTGGAGAAIVAVLRQTLTERNRLIQAALAAGQHAELARLGHLTKAGARSVGLLRLASLCEMIEQEARGGDLTSLAAAIDQEFRGADDLLDQLLRQ